MSRYPERLRWLDVNEPEIDPQLGARYDVVDLLRELGHKTVVGVFVGGCVSRGVGSSFRALGHTHNRADDEFVGWICVRSPRRLLTPSGKPSRILLHEVAHTIAPKAGHGSTAFIRALASVGIHTDGHSRAGRARRDRAKAAKPDGVRCRLCRKAIRLERAAVVDGMIASVDGFVWIHEKSGRVACVGAAE